jgi:Tol biopolymer transport system component
MKHGLKVDDLVGIKSIGSPSISPDGSTVVYTLGTINLKENKTDNDIYTVSLGEEPRKLTESGKAGLPTWSPDGEWIAST